MDRRLTNLLTVGYVLVGLTAFFVSVQHLPAGFSPSDLEVAVEIDGVDYGVFDNVAGLKTVALEEKETGSTTVTFKRAFVTDPSLYLWAKNIANRHSQLKDIHLVTRDEQGTEVNRRVLKLCQPISWAVEAASEGLGGFHETVEIAVQDVTTVQD